MLNQYLRETGKGEVYSSSTMMWEMRRSKVSCPKANKVSNFVQSDEGFSKHFREVSLDGAAGSVRVLLLSQPNKSSIVCLIC